MSIPESSIEKLHDDHAYLHALIERMRSCCTPGAARTDCRSCQPAKQRLCRSNVEQLIRTFIQTTLKHHLLESLLMENHVPEPHRQAHNAAHLVLAERLDQIRAVLADDGETVLAIDGLEQFESDLMAHETGFDGPMLQYLQRA